MPTTLGVVGAGSVLSALTPSRSRSAEPIDLIFFDTLGALDADLAGMHGLAVVASTRELAARCDVILVATEPGDALDTLEALAPYLGEDHIVIVSSAGVALDRLRSALGPVSALLRIALDQGGVEDGALAVSPEPGTALEVVERTAQVLACIGVVEVLPEDSLETGNAVICSSIGFLATALAGVEDGAVKAGLPRDVARVFVRQTALATALLLQDHPGSPADLKDQVASPGGTTIAGLAVLEDLGVRGAFIRAVEAAVVRAREKRDEELSHVVE